MYRDFIFVNILLVVWRVQLVTTTFTTLRGNCVSHLIVICLKCVSGLLEGFETLPACFSRTWTRYTVTFTHALHLAHSLQHTSWSVPSLVDTRNENITLICKVWKNKDTTITYHKKLILMIKSVELNYFNTKHVGATWHWKVRVTFFAIYIHSNEIHDVAALIVYWCIGVSFTCFGT